MNTKRRFAIGKELRPELAEHEIESSVWNGRSRALPSSHPMIAPRLGSDRATSNIEVQSDHTPVRHSVALLGVASSGFRRFSSTVDAAYSVKIFGQVSIAVRIDLAFSSCLSPM